MKKVLFASVAILAAFTSCSVKETLDIETPVAEGSRLSFVGETFAQTKITVGDKQDGKYPVLWTEGDVIGIISPEDTIFSNASASLYGKGGTSTGTFMLDKETKIPNDVDVLIYYPRSSFTKVKESQDADFKTVYSLASNVLMEQSMPKAGDVSNIGKYVLAWSKASIKKTSVEGGEEYQEPVKFTLEHSVAYVKLVISSSAYSSMKLAGASLWADGAALTGDIAVDLSTGEVNNTLPREYAVVTVDEPEVLSGKQELWLVTLPCDLTGKDMYVSVALTDGNKNVTIPVKLAGGKLKANTVNVINVAAEKNDIAWYEPEETRYLAEGWCYGNTNCVLVTDPDAPIELDVKARGYFMGAKEPKYIYASNLNYGSTAFKLSINGTPVTAVAAGTAKDASNTVAVTDGKVTLSFTGSNTSTVVMSAKLILLDAEFQPVWAFTLWPAWAYKDGVIAHKYKCGKEVMDRNLGDGCAPTYANWHGMGLYFQWGRPFCFGWSGGGAYKTAPTSVKSLKENGQLADTFLYTDGVENTMSDWWLGDWTRRRTDRKDDFWGNPNTDDTVDGSAVTGTKSIFDPCPKGWMVCSPDVIKEVAQLGDDQLKLFETASTATSNGEWGKYIRAIFYKYGDKDEDVAIWKFDGLKWGSNAGNPYNQVNDICCYYSNSSMHSTKASDTYIFSLYYRSKDGKWSFGGSRNSGCSVRCMKDVDNR